MCQNSSLIKVINSTVEVIPDDNHPWWKLILFELAKLDHNLARKVISVYRPCPLSFISKKKVTVWEDYGRFPPY